MQIFKLRLIWLNSLLNINFKLSFATIYFSEKFSSSKPKPKNYEKIDKLGKKPIQFADFWLKFGDLFYIDSFLINNCRDCLISDGIV